MVQEKQWLIASSLVSPTAALWQQGCEGASDNHNSNTVHVTASEWHRLVWLDLPNIWSWPSGGD